MATLEANLDYLSPEFLSNPYPTLAKFRSQSPVIWDSKFQTGYSSGVGAWHVFSYAEIQSLLRDRNISSEMPPLELERYPEQAREIMNQLFSMTQKAIVWSDPPKHTRLRSLVGKAFNSQTIEKMRPRIQEIVDELLDKLQDIQRIEFVQGFAELLPLNVVSDLIGFPTEDHLKIRNWVANEAAFYGGSAMSLESMYQSRSDFLDYIQEQISQHRQHLGEDLLSALIAAQEDGDRLNDSELEGMVWLIMNAGYESTVTLLGNGILAMLKNPEQMKLLRENPSLVEGAIEEILRYDAPVQFIHRIAKDDFEFQGHLIKAGQDVYLWLGAANHDPAVFSEPDRFDITRKIEHHLGFGYGLHLCIGAPLARLEGKIAFNTILQRWPEFYLGAEGHQQTSNPGVRGLKSLELVF